MDLGDNKAILGYPWFALVQPQIDWKRGWIDHSQLPIIFQAPNAAKACISKKKLVLFLLIPFLPPK